MLVIYFFRRSSCCPYYQGVHNSEVSVRRELTVVLKMKITQKLTGNSVCCVKKKKLKKVFSAQPNQKGRFLCWIQDDDI